jgi:hypothetical protein
MGLQALWSLGLACLDCYALKFKKDLHSAVLLSLFVVGDWVIINDFFSSHVLFTSVVPTTIEMDKYLETNQVKI